VIFRHEREKGKQTKETGAKSKKKGGLENV
jgi:hypothetical protein